MSTVREAMRGFAFSATIPEYNKIIKEIQAEADKGHMSMFAICSDAVAERLRSEGFEVEKIPMNTMTNKYTISW